MVKINVHDDCGNAPKKLYLKDFVISIVKNESTFISDNITDDIRWNVIGGQNISGKPDVLAELQQSRNNEVNELIINTIVTHGYDGVVDGLLKFKDGKAVAFCDIYRFSSPRNNAPIETIKTFMWKTTPQDHEVSKSFISN